MNKKPAFFSDERSVFFGVLHKFAARFLCNTLNFNFVLATLQQTDKNCYTYIIMTGKPLIEYNLNRKEGDSNGLLTINSRAELKLII